MLTRKYRPQVFKDVVGQDIPKLLLQGILRQRDALGVPSPLIFSGAYGSGKTTMARIFSRALLCEKGQIEPCNQCQSCRDFLAGRHYQYRELDAASFGKKEEVEKLKDDLTFVRQGWMIILWDEAHLFSDQALNALLKLFEEPPERVVFMFASTEAHKIIETILSRSFLLEFKTLPIDRVTVRLKEICDEESIEYTENGVSLLSHSSQGHLRDAIMGLDRLRYLGKVTEESVVKVIGSSLRLRLLKVLFNIAGGDAGEIYRILAGIFEQNFLLKVSRELFNLLTKIAIYKHTNGSESDFTIEEQRVVKEILKKFDIKFSKIIREFITLRKDMELSENNFYLACVYITSTYCKKGELKINDIQRLRARSVKQSPIEVLTQIPGVTLVGTKEGNN